MSHRITIRLFVLATTIAGTAIAYAGCDDGRSKQLTTSPDREHHPQSPLLRGGSLEWYYSFYGTVGSNGMILPQGATTPPISGQIEGERRPEPPAWAEPTVTFKQVDDDPCTRDAAGNLIGRLPLYLVTDSKGQNLCANQVVTLAAIPELTHCDASSDPQVQLAAFNKVHELAVAIPGWWNDNGRYALTALNGDPAITLACITGVVGKCAHWGYLPWASKDGQSLAEYHHACVRAARAEYRSDGDVFTCAFTEVDIFDRLDIQKRRNPPEMTDESYWNETGVTCIARPRYLGCNPPILPTPDGCAEPGTWKIGVASKGNILPGDAPPIDECPQSKTFPNPNDPNPCRRW